MARNSHIDRDPSRSLKRKARYGTDRTAGAYEEIIYGHPDAWDGYLRLRMEFGRAPWALAPVDGEEAHERIFRRRAENVLKHLTYDSDQYSDISDAFSGIADAICFGSAVYEATWTETGRLDLAPIPLSSIQYWEETPDGPAPVQDGVTIPASRIIRITPIPMGGPDGIALMRPLVFLFELWKQILEDLGLRSHKEAGGVVLTQKQGVGDDEARSTVELAALFAEGDQLALSLPHGWEHQFHTLPQGIDRKTYLDYFDDAIRKLFDDTIASLIGASTGSRALGDAANQSDSYDDALRMDYCIGLFGRRVLSFIARSTGYDGRLPSLTTQVDTSISTQELVTTATSAASLTGWYERDRDDLRDRLGMPPVPEAGREIQVQTPALFSRIDGDSESYEKVMDWETLATGRVKDEMELANSVGRLADRLRSRLRAALADGILTEDERDTLEDEFLPAFYLLYLEYAQKRRNKAYAWGDRLLDRITSAGGIQETTSQVAINAAYAMAESLQRGINRVEEMADVQARTTFQRIVGEFEYLRSMGAELETQITDAGLAQGGNGVGHAAEQIGRMEGTESAALQRGLAVVGAWRSSFEDDDRCGHCRASSDRFYDADDLPQLPDPDCEGSAIRCRCGLIPVIRKVTP